MPKKHKNQSCIKSVQRCEKSLDGCISTIRAESAAQVNSASGRGTQQLRAVEPSVSPDTGALNPSRKVPMSTTSNPTRLSNPRRHTEIHIRYGSAPFRVLVYPYPVEIEVRPAPRRRAA